MRLKVKTKSNGEVIELEIFGFAKVKDTNNQDIYQPQEIKIVTEPLGYSTGASLFTIVVDGNGDPLGDESIHCSRMYKSTLDKMEVINIDDEFTDNTDEVWIKTHMPVNTDIQYIEI